MTQETQQEKPKRNTKVTEAPKKVLELIEKLPLPDFRKLKTKIDEIFEVARKEQYPDFATGMLVRQALEPHYSGRTIQRVLPETAKDQTHTTLKAKSGFKKADTEKDEDKKPQTDYEHELEVIGTENTTRDNTVSYNDFFEIEHNSQKYKIDTKKLHEYPRDVLEEMINHLVGVTEFQKGELEASLKQVEDLRATNKRIQSNYDAAQLTIKRFEEKVAEKIKGEKK